MTINKDWQDTQMNLILVKRKRGAFGGIGGKKELKCYVYAPTPHNECNNYILHTCTTKKIFF